MTKNAKSDSKPSTARQRDPLARAIALLNLMIDADDQDFGVRRLANDLGVSASTAHRLLTELEQLDLVARSDEGVYRVGLGLYHLAMRANARFPLRQLALPHLRHLRGAVNESTFLGLYDEATQSMVFAATVESTQPLRYVVELNKPVPMHAGASGLAILAHLPKEAIDDILARPELPPVTEQTMTDQTSLRPRLDEIRAAGYALSRGERIPGALAIAAPVLGPLGTAIGDLGVTMPESRFNSTHEASIADQVRSIAADLTRRIQRDER